MFDSNTIRTMSQEIEELRRLATTVQSPQFGERVQTGRDTEAKFVKILYKIDDYEERIVEKMDLLVELKNQISIVIGNVEHPDEQLVLRYRYLLGETWEMIGEMLNADERTVRRWHSKALNKIVLPDNAIDISCNEMS